MKISLITAVFNRRPTVADAIRSAASQSHRNFEHIIQDGGSSDGTIEIVEALRYEKMSIVSEPDAGIYDALNRGIKRCDGDVVGFLHSDDILAHDCVLSKVAEAFEDPAIDGVYGDLDYVASDDISRIIRRWRSGDYEPSSIGWGWMPPHPTLYLRRKVYDEFGLYDTSYSIAADYEAMLRYLVVGRIRLCYIEDVMVKMRVGGESNRSIGRILKKSQEDYRAIRRHRVGGFGTLFSKNLRKINQFIATDR